jgi:hypothetical protein|tara:strand:- start:905 stop:2365 length:1461 start_codon:yes stop_codon:yes gene_type:complete
MGTLTSNSPDLTPHPKKGVALNSNYLSFTGGQNDFAQQYLPELYEAEVERYGNRTIGGFLRMVGAEMPMSSDQIVWSEQTRLHIAYDTCAIAGASHKDKIDITVPSGKDCAIKVNQTIVVQGNSGEMTALVTAVPANTGAQTTIRITCLPYTNDNFVDTAAGIFGATEAVTVFVYGSEYGKGLDPTIETLTPDFQKYENKPIILRDKFVVNGSDVAQIGWVEVATEDGASGYLWYLKAESETRLRFEDYMEMSMVEAEKKSGTSAVTVDGSEGLFAAIKDRGQVMDGFAAAGSGTGAVADFDAILKQLDKEGAIEENMLFLNRGLALDFDDMLAQVNGGYAGTGPNLGASFGLFNNEAEMALNLGFSGFRRGSYDFYKTDWKYLNDAATRGVLGVSSITPGNTVEGVLVPAGTSTVYDQILGQNIRRPFLHVRYRASEADDRRMKSWVTGSVGGAYTSGLDAMEVHFLSERALCVQGANNFVLFQA